MNEVIVNGGIPLSGKIDPDGSKNAALPIIFSTMLMRGVSKIYGVPDIGDVDVAIEIIKKYGASVTRRADVLTIDTKNLRYIEPPVELIGKIRASSYLIGACIARFGIFHMTEFGGCNFCNRPIDMHIKSALKLGAKIEDGIISAKRLFGCDIFLEKQSVGATINSILMASIAEGSTRIFGAANEPHVRNLITFLKSSGICIETYENTVLVSGTEASGGSVSVIPDMIEAGTYLIAGTATRGDIWVKYDKALELDSFFDVLDSAGMDIIIDNGYVSIKGEVKRPIYIKTLPHPGFPTDLQPQFAPFMAIFAGGVIKENVWKNRFSYLDSLKLFGVNFDIIDNVALIKKSNIHSAISYASDLRGGAAALIAALSARGCSKIKNTEKIRRGYSDIWNKLRSLGADITDI